MFIDIYKPLRLPAYPSFPSTYLPKYMCLLLEGSICVGGARLSGCGTWAGIAKLP